MQRRRLNDLQENFLRTLWKEENSFSNSIIPISTLSEAQCLEIYSRGYLARLIEALGETFEATWWVLGDDDFFSLSSRFIATTPSFHFDLSEYGASFSEFLAAQAQAQEIPFLSDLAKFEWAFKNIFHKPNLSTSKTNRSLVLRDENMKFILSDSAALFSSQFSIYEIWKKRTQPIENLRDIDHLKSEHLLISKQNSQVHVHALEADEFLIVNELAKGRTLGNSIEALLSKGNPLTPERVQRIFAAVSALGVLSM